MPSPQPASSTRVPAGRPSSTAGRPAALPGKSGSNPTPDRAYGDSPRAPRTRRGAPAAGQPCCWISRSVAAGAAASGPDGPDDRWLIERLRLRRVRRGRDHAGPWHQHGLLALLDLRGARSAPPSRGTPLRRFRSAAGSSASAHRPAHRRRPPAPAPVASPSACVADRRPGVRSPTRPAHGWSA